ncbi:hypothetical protein WME98_37115 [Sorangium sp. So ce296]|uniref:hypothetical protein n=1 Tax=Sorangium sp. So ce296 TaxID=3133296 RepID=UPI003F637E0C
MKASSCPSGQALGHSTSAHGSIGTGGGWGCNGGSTHTGQQAPAAERGSWPSGHASGAHWRKSHPSLTGESSASHARVEYGLPPLRLTKQLSLYVSSASACFFALHSRSMPSASSARRVNPELKPLLLCPERGKPVWSPLTLTEHDASPSSMVTTPAGPQSPVTLTVMLSASFRTHVGMSPPCATSEAPVAISATSSSF